MNMKTNHKNRNRVVITGMGWITPLGHDIETVWSALLAGKSGVGPIDHFDASTFPTTFAGQVKEYDFTRLVADPSLHEHTSLNTRFALGAARQAWTQSGLEDHRDLDRTRVGLYLGAGEGPPDFPSAALTNLAAWDVGGNHVDPTTWIQHAHNNIEQWKEIEQEPNMTIRHLAMEFKVSGPACNCLTACAASTQAVGEAMELIRRGDAEVMIAGGTHTMIHTLGVTGFNRLTALSTRNDDPTGASRPFDSTRDGFVLGEGSGILILESLDHALARNANILAELTGFGSSADAFRITDMEPTGRGAHAAMQHALIDAGINPHEPLPDGRPPIQYISAHGTSTKENDSTESTAIRSVFGPIADQIPVSSIKSMMGHLIAAAGAVELITGILTIRNGQIPPTMNYQHPDPECDLDYVPNEARSAQVDTILSNSFGFGGQNDCLIASLFKPETADGSA